VTGPLTGVRVVEIASIGPGPFAAMVFADLGAEVVRIDRPGRSPSVPGDPLLRGRAAQLILDLKSPAAVASVLRLASGADVLIEGFRPGVAERLGIGPRQCAGVNPRLVYGRVTGWGQEGPRSGEVGHDIDYIAIAGALHPIGQADAPPRLLNLIADSAVGECCSSPGCSRAVERAGSGAGQVVDAAMVDGAALLMAMHHGLAASGVWSEARESNLLDGGAPFYRCYRTADDRFMAVGAIEPKFYAALLAGLGLDGSDLPDQYDRAGWPVLRDRLAAVFATQSRDEWAAVFAGTEACVAPVLTPAEAPSEPHLGARGTFVTIDGLTQPAPAPRFSRSIAAAPASVPRRSAAAVLQDFGLSAAEAGDLLGAADPA
jgi:alpha-methylacyl-CoA racemase